MSDLWERLYAISAFSFTFVSFLVSLLPNIRDYQGAIYTQENITRFSEIILFRNLSIVNDSESYKMDLERYVRAIPETYLAVTFLSLICMLIFFASVKYIKVKKPNLKRQYQRNIVTFNQNFFFYICFFNISVSLTLVKIFVPHLTPSENTKIILLFLYVLRLMFICFLRPIIIIFLLKKRMPHFFENYNMENGVVSIFYISGNNVLARNELFKPLKSFSQNARFGSEKKFNQLNSRIENHYFLNFQRNKEKDRTRKSMLSVGRRKINVDPVPNIH